MDGYLENAMDYVQETFESANEWMKENDPFYYEPSEEGPKLKFKRRKKSKRKKL